MHELAIEIAIELRRAAMRAIHQLIAEIDLRLLTLSDRLCDLTYRRACAASKNRSMHPLMHLMVAAIAYHWDGACERLEYK